MSPAAKRLLIRLAGFVGAAVGVALWQQPWAQTMSSHVVAGWVWAFSGGVLGLIAFEVLRRRMADQVALDRAEEDALSEEAYRKLRRNRWICRIFFAIGLPLWFDVSVDFSECFQYPGTCVFANVTYMLFGCLLGEFVAMLDPRQWVYSRVARRRRAG